MITKDEWHRTAEFAAAAKWGEEHKSWYVFRRFGLPTIAALVAIGGVGFLAWKAWTGLSGAVSGSHGVGAHAPFWVIGAVLVMTTAAVFRPRVVPAATHSLIVKGGFLLVLWLGFIAYGIGMLVS